jgi:hypothetical protein
MSLYERIMSNPFSRDLWERTIEQSSGAIHAHAHEHIDSRLTMKRQNDVDPGWYMAHWFDIQTKLAEPAGFLY